MTTFPASFPVTDLPVTIELYAGADWRDITDDWRQRTPLAITRGLSDEATSITPSSASFELDNTSGDYDPDDPMGAYYGSLDQGTPVRINIGAVDDEFDRTATAGWGTATSGEVWQTAVTGAGQSTADVAVDGGSATHVVHTAGNSCTSFTTTVWGDVDVALTCSIDVATVTGSTIVPANVLLRGQDQATFILMRLSLDTAQVMTIALEDSAGIHYTDNVATDVDFTSPFRFRCQVEGQTVRAKVWTATDPEPAGWMSTANMLDAVLSAAALRLDAPGWVGIRSSSNASNTNGEITFTYSDVVIRVPRYAGVLASLQPLADQSDNDHYCTIQAGSVLRQLAQGTLSVQSPLRHDIPTLANLIAYWPMEDDASATSFSAVTAASGDMQVAAGTPQPASDSTFIGSAALPNINSASLYGYTGSTDKSGAVQVRALFKFPDAGTIDNATVLMRLHTHGTVIRWDVIYATGGALNIQVFDSDSKVFDMGAVAFNVDGKALRLGLWITPDGSDLSCQLSTYEQLASEAGFIDFTVTGESIQDCYSVAIAPPGNDIKSTVVGHVTVEKAATTDPNTFELLAQVNAFTGETTLDRLARLCGYIGVEFAYVGDDTALSALMGAQPIDTVMNLLTQCAETDGGVLYEAKGSHALMYRTAGAHMAAPVVAALDVQQGHLAAPPQKTHDDQRLKNDWVVSQLGGGQAEAQLTEGRRSVLPPPDGVGVYQDTLTINGTSAAQLEDMAWWLLHVTTAPDARYPTVDLNLASEHLTGDAALWWSILAVDVDSQVSVANFRPDLVYLLARGYSEQFTTKTYASSFNAAPGAPYRTLRLDDGVSRLDSGSSTLADDIDETATSFDVATSDPGDLWTTDSADLPLDIKVGGEQITVGTVTGSSSPQTFSDLTRSVNGITKAHVAGVEVHIADIRYLALGRPSS